MEKSPHLSFKYTGEVSFFLYVLLLPAYDTRRINMKTQGIVPLIEEVYYEDIN